MELREYLRVLRRGWKLAVFFIVLGIAAGVALTLTTTKVYQATVQVFVAISTSNDAAALSQGQIFAQNRVQSYTSIVNSPEVTTPVIQDLGLNLTDQELGDKITADAPADKVLININVTDGSPAQAAKLANAVAQQFNVVVAKTEQTAASGASVVKLTVIHPAVEPTSPIKPNPLLNIGLGLALGIILGVGLVILRDVLDNTVKGPGDFERFDLPVLGMVPLDKRTVEAPVAFRQDPYSARSEAYRLLRTNMQFINVDSAPRVIAVTSAVPAEGKTTTALNLAAALAEAGHRVCLIEADLRRPNIGTNLGLVKDVGLTTVLIGQVELVDALQNFGQNLVVLTAGPVPPNPSELLNSEQARAVIAEMAEHVDYTILDTAPLLAVADGAEVAAMADATLLVHRSGKTTREQVTRSIQALEKVGERPVGVVLNMASRNAGGDEYGYYQYYAYRPNRPARSSRRDDDAQSDVTTHDDVPASDDVETDERRGSAVRVGD